MQSNMFADDCRKKNNNSGIDVYKTEIRAHGYSFCNIAGWGANAAVLKLFRNNVYFACKVSTKTDVLEREKFFLELIDNSAFPKLCEFWKSGDMAYLVTEYASGMNMDAYIRKRGFLAQEEAVEAALQIAGGISYLENMHIPILYRDLKAENIMYDTGIVKIVDMGCVCFLDSAGRERVGTRGYAPLEQISDKTEDITLKQGMYSDVYAFGRLLHYMLTGDSPYLPPYDKPGIRYYDNRLDKDLELLIAMCIKENPYERLPDMRYVKRELENICRKKKSIRLKKLWSDGIHRRRRMGEYIYEKNICLI